MLLIAGITTINYIITRKVKSTVVDVHTVINSRLDELIKVTKELARLEGYNEGTLANKDKSQDV